MAPILREDPQPFASPLVFKEIVDLFQNEATWDAFSQRLDPANSIPAVNKKTFYAFRDDSDDDIEEGATHKAPEGDEEKQDELEEDSDAPNSNFTEGTSSWKIGKQTWEWERSRIDFDKLSKLDIPEAEKLATNLYNLFCCELGNNPFSTLEI